MTDRLVLLSFLHYLIVFFHSTTFHMSYIFREALMLLNLIFMLFVCSGAGNILRISFVEKNKIQCSGTVCSQTIGF